MNDVTKITDPYIFLDDVSDLNRNSSKTIRVACPLCNQERMAVFSAIVKANHTFCKGCAKRMSNAKYIGATIGRLAIAGIDTSQKGTLFIVKCSCGSCITVVADNVLSGKTTSCGCYRNEVVSARSGTLSHAYRHDMSDEDRQELAKMRLDGNYRSWRKALLERDKNMCAICGSKDGLCAHHVRNFRTHQELRYEIGNGVTMCKACHTAFHSWNGGVSKPCDEDDLFFFRAALELDRSLPVTLRKSYSRSEIFDRQGVNAYQTARALLDTLKPR